MKKRIIVGITIILVILLVTGIACVWKISDMQKQEWQRFRHEEYDGIFCSMYDVSGFDEEDFLNYRGIKVIKWKKSLKSLQNISECIKTAYENKIELHTVYLGIDPVQIWEESKKTREVWEQNIEDNIVYFLEQYPDTMFEIILPYPRLDYWTDMEEDVLTESMLVYQSFVSLFENRNNVKIYYLGDEEWLYRNKDNYVTDFGVNEGVAHYILLATFCDGEYQIDLETLVNKQDGFKDQIKQENNSPTEYPDFSKYSIVFLGDSIIGIDRGTTSIPGIVSAMSGAETYNVGKGGLTAGWQEDTYSFLTMVEVMEDPEKVNTLGEVEFRQDMEAFLDESRTDDELFFVINFGLNDYFQGKRVENSQDTYDITTYAGALRTGIDRLKIAYPHAKIVLMGPTYISLYEDGAEPMSEEGGILSDYTNVAKKVAEECDVIFQNNHEVLGIDDSNEQMYLSDGCHLNHQGRYIYGMKVIELLESIE